MISLDSDRWGQLTSPASTNGRLALKYLQKYVSGDKAALSELYEQACHQFTLGDVAFAIAPYLLNDTNQINLDALVFLGTIRACQKRHNLEVPQDLVEEYELALEKSLTLTTHLLLRRLSPGDTRRVLGVLAALKGEYNLAIHIFSHGGADDDLSCPHCGEYLKW